MKHHKKYLATEGICYQGAACQEREARREGRKNNLKEERQCTTRFMKPLFKVIFAELLGVFFPSQARRENRFFLSLILTSGEFLFKEGRCTKKGLGS